MSPRPSLPSTLPESDGPLVSVVVPTYEDAELVDAALESIAAQTHSAVEAVIVDSSGVDWLEALAAETDWIRYAYQEPAGLSAARNYGIDLAEGEYVSSSTPTTSGSPRNWSDSSLPLRAVLTSCKATRTSSRTESGAVSPRFLSRT